MNKQHTLEQARKFTKLLKPMFDLVEVYEESIDLDRQTIEARQVLDGLRKDIEEQTACRDRIVGEARTALANSARQIDNDLSEAKDRAQVILAAAERDAQTTIGRALSEAAETTRRAEAKAADADRMMEEARQLTASQEARKVELAKEITGLERQRDAIRRAIQQATAIEAA